MPEPNEWVPNPDGQGTVAQPSGEAGRESSGGVDWLWGVLCCALFCRPLLRRLFTHGTRSRFPTYSPHTCTLTSTPDHGGSVPGRVGRGSSGQAGADGAATAADQEGQVPEGARCQARPRGRQGACMRGHGAWLVARAFGRLGCVCLRPLVELGVWYGTPPDACGRPQHAAAMLPRNAEARVNTRPHLLTPPPPRPSSPSSPLLLRRWTRRCCGGCTSSTARGPTTSTSSPHCCRRGRAESRAPSSRWGTCEAVQPSVEAEAGAGAGAGDGAGLAQQGRASPRGFTCPRRAAAARLCVTRTPAARTAACTAPPILKPPLSLPP